MANNEAKRQKKLAKQKAKHKKATESKAKSGPAMSEEARQMIVAAKSPLYECLLPEDLFEMGMGHVIFSRRLPIGSIGASVFLLDTFCLGIKDAFFSVLTPLEYDSLKQRGAIGRTFVSMEPGCCRKLIEDAVAYARDLGFSPHKDYELARKIFGDVDASACAEEFEFGQDGKPLYISGPYESPVKVAKILDTLERRCGPKGFNVMLMGQDEDEFEDEDIDEDMILGEEFDARPEIVRSQFSAGLMPPTFDFLLDLDPTDADDVMVALADLIDAMDDDYFQAWQAIVRKEEDQPLRPEDQEILMNLGLLDLAKGERVVSIDNNFRPAEPWYEVVRKLAPSLVVEQLIVAEPDSSTLIDYVDALMDVLSTSDSTSLPLPEGIASPVEVFPEELRHRLWLQGCFAHLTEIGGFEEGTLEIEEEQLRISDLIECLEDHKDSVRYFNLSLQSMLKMVVLPARDEKVFIQLMQKVLKLPSLEAPLANYLGE